MALVAAALLALSFALDLYSEVRFTLASMAFGATRGFAVGRLSLTLLWFAPQVWVLFKLAQGRSWARIAFIVIVALTMDLRYTALTSPIVQLYDASPTIVLLQTAMELAAVVLVLMAGPYFSPHAGA
jgi:hypothetical protein